jgi:predicted Fe-S protein YdhL (DUF1289 family)
MFKTSPCNNICSMDPKSGTCVGCRRTIAEIASWGGMSEEERRNAMAAIEARPWPDAR